MRNLEVGWHWVYDVAHGKILIPAVLACLQPNHIGLCFERPSLT